MAKGKHYSRNWNFDNSKDTQETWWLLTRYQSYKCIEKWIWFTYKYQKSSLLNVLYTK